MKMSISTCKHTLHRGLRLTLALALLLAACTTQDWPYSPHREGVGSIAVTLEGSQTRATTSVITKEEADLFLVTLYKGEVEVSLMNRMRYEGEDLIAQQTMLGHLGSLTFPAGYGYSLFVESITEQDALTLNEGWGAKRYTGKSKSFGIQAGQTTKVAVGCSVANAAVAVNIDSSAQGCVVTLKTSDGRTLTTTESRVAYVNVTIEEKPDVTITIEKDGEVVKETTLENLDASQVKDINIKENTEGTLGLQVTYDDSFETVQTEISIETE